MSVRDVIQAAAGAAGTTADKTYIEDVFSTYLYTGNGGSQTINNGIQLGGGPANGTVLHLTGDTLTDSAPVPSSFESNIGPVTVNTTTKKYGTGSLYFNGSSKIITSSNANVAIDANEDFTVEAWINPTYFTTNSTLYCIATPRVGSGSWYFGIYYGKIFAYDESLSVFYGSGSITANTWQHVAYTRQGTIHRLFLNGVLTDSRTADAQAHLSTKVSIASDNSGSVTIASPFYGYIDDFRITKGIARYTANFTPPTAALPLDTLVAGKGGMVWTKARNVAYNNCLNDTVRGISNRVISNLTSAQTTVSNSITSATSTGYNLGADDSLAFNESGNKYVSWTFRKAPKFFDVVTYTGNGDGSYTINHNLGSVPGMIIVKSTSTTSDWIVGHREMNPAGPWSWSMALNSTAAKQNYYANFAGSQPTSTQFYVGDNANTNGVTYVAYLFAHDTTTDGLIQCGSYTGTGSPGNKITLGWEPQWILIKGTDKEPNDWYVVDNMRGVATSGDTARLSPNLSNAEVINTSPNGYGRVEFHPDGFSVNDPPGGIYNRTYNGAVTYIYMAIRRGPMRTPTDGTKVYATDTFGGTLPNPPAFNSNFPVDLGFYRVTNGTSFWYWNDRLRGAKNLYSNSTSAEDTAGAANIKFDYMDGYYAGTSVDSSYRSWMLRRAPGFFDVVCYTGTKSGSGTQIVPHNLGVAPELTIHKQRNGTSSWFANTEFGASQSRQGTLNSSGALPLTSYATNDLFASKPTVNQLEIGWPYAPTSQTFVVYLFASCPGVSKIGSFTMLGSSMNIDCGFTNGARFVLLKATSISDDWWVFDTARGIVAGNDPYLLLNLTSAEGTASDMVDPYSPGFTVTSSYAASGKTYIYLAIA